MSTLQPSHATAALTEPVIQAVRRDATSLTIDPVRHHRYCRPPCKSMIALGGTLKARELCDETENETIWDGIVDPEVAQIGDD